MSPEHRASIAKARLGSRRSPESIAKMVATRRAAGSYRHTQETRAKIRASQQARRAERDHLPMSTDRCIAIPTNILLKPNFTKFAKQLELHPTMALGVLTRFYAFVPNVSYDGDLAEFEIEDIETGVGWTGEPSALIKALLDNGFMTTDSKVADWPERFPFYAGALRRRAIREAKRAAIEGAAK